MRQVIAHTLAIVTFIVVLYFGLAAALGFALTGTGGFRIRLADDQLSYSVLYTLFVAPFALAATLIYFALLRASVVSMIALAALAGLAFIGALTTGHANLSLLVCASAVAALAHHLVYAVLRPRPMARSA